VLIVRPSGPAARFGWSIPKGLPNPGESLEAAARRETHEECGVLVTTALTSLGYVDYSKSKKRVHAFTADMTNATGPEAQPRVASWEIDTARYVSLDEAKRVLHADQRAFVDRIAKLAAPL
jgi:predicted NUDIX family NTP pyrophosphohydrolase